MKPLVQIADTHKAQAINYLAAELAIILNFGEPSLHQERIVRYKNS